MNDIFDKYPWKHGSILKLLKLVNPAPKKESMTTLVKKKAWVVVENDDPNEKARLVAKMNKEFRPLGVFFVLANTGDIHKRYE